MASGTPTPFTQRERNYLESLPAVSRVTGARIHYTDEFRDECLRRYGAGEHPVDLFRQAGLDPRLIGYKRIERCFARWRANARQPTSQATTHTRNDSDDERDHLIAQQALKISRLEHTVEELRRQVERAGRKREEPR